MTIEWLRDKAHDAYLWLLLTAMKAVTHLVAEETKWLHARRAELTARVAVLKAQR